ncbi:hypothetical protein CAPTEDRAFT_152090 [Capitella teleta]|uniref:Alpha-methylacyl-CoA racemase n=1 Tax=Capitella teleta TaxID=283909 RepID=R7T7Y7_CAPTE|nr:hypothetical protein CAPTEDRAFT_152090 [Capitella teleta]|eukprot:ELT87540.1 hypothetical protein CAPTEDRAFT_152090 [Capitella teleta]
MALKGVRVVELAGLAPAPFCGMVLSDFGANVVRVDRARAGNALDRLARGKQSIAVDLKQKEGINVVRKLCCSADVLIEPFRKGVMERLGLGPDQLMSENPRLIYARMTGYGQKGDLSNRAGHDINYLAISGMLSRLGRQGEKPYAPINLLADFAGGGLMCAMGILMALMERHQSGKGQIVDASMVEGAAYVSSFVWQSVDLPMWGAGRGEGWLDGAAPWYDTYETSDGKFMAVGAIEPQFYTQLIKGLGLEPHEAWQFNNDWPQLREKFAKKFASKTQAEWCAIFDEVDACVTPVLSMEEAASYPHNKQLGTFRKKAQTGLTVPRPAPALSRTPGATQELNNPEAGQHTYEILSALGYKSDEMKRLVEAGAVEQAETASKL